MRAAYYHLTGIDFRNRAYMLWAPRKNLERDAKLDVEPIQNFNEGYWKLKEAKFEEVMAQVGKQAKVTRSRESKAQRKARFEAERGNLRKMIRNLRQLSDDYLFFSEEDQKEDLRDATHFWKPGCHCNRVKFVFTIDEPTPGFGEGAFPNK